MNMWIEGTIYSLQSLIAVEWKVSKKFKVFE